MMLLDYAILQCTVRRYVSRVTAFVLFRSLEWQMFDSYRQMRFLLLCCAAFISSNAIPISNGKMVLFTER
jgi:hypothetical protein